MPRKIIIDTDPGIDDAMAIFLALRSPELDVIGLTTIFGNVHTGLATTNALRLLEIAGRADIPVAKGAENTLTGDFAGPAAFVHGDDGQGNVFLPPPTTEAIDMPAAQFIVEEIMTAPGEVTLVPLGPLTNIALALRLEPRIAQQVQEVVLMGGNAFEPGNATPSAEANIHNDPDAADIVFNAPWPVTMVGLDVTHKVHMHPPHLDAYASIDNPMARHVARILPFYRQFYKQAVALDYIYVHDSSAIAYVIDPGLFTVVEYAIRVDTSPGISRGKTWVARNDIPFPTWGPWQNRPNVKVCLEVRGDAVVELELSRMRGK
jgi:inosine-uridine nucleoside N-ribohydrolase